MLRLQRFFRWRTRSGARRELSQSNRPMAGARGRTCQQPAYVPSLAAWPPVSPRLPEDRPTGNISQLAVSLSVLFRRFIKERFGVCLPRLGRFDTLPQQVSHVVEWLRRVAGIQGESTLSSPFAN